MYKSIIFLFSALLASAMAGYAGSSSGNNVGKDGSFGYGYGGSGYVPGGVPFVPPFPFDFSAFLEGYLEALKKHYQFLNDNLQHYVNQAQRYGGSSGGYGGSSGGYGGAFSGSFASPGGYGSGFGVSSGQPAYPEYGQGGFAGKFGPGPYGYGAGASASFDGSNVQQSAYLNPENPAVPNVNVRFSDGGGAPYGKSFSVLTSSSSGSGNVDGKPYGYRHASTSINDNGKVSTYSVHD